MQINAPVPDFTLADGAGGIHRLSDLRERPVVVNFWSAECPWSARADAHLLDLLARLDGTLELLTVASNRNETPAMIEEARLQRGLPFVLRDEGAALANAFDAQTTPHVFLIDAAGVLRYRGAVDDVTFRKRAAGRFYLEEALAALFSGRNPDPQETPAYGCTIVRHV